MDSIFSAAQSGLVDTVKRSWPQPLIIDDELDGLTSYGVVLTLLLGSIGRACRSSAGRARFISSNPRAT